MVTKDEKADFRRRLDIIKEREKQKPDSDEEPVSTLFPILGQETKIPLSPEEIEEKIRFMSGMFM